jgi:hypothetical protein
MLVEGCFGMLAMVDIPSGIMMALKNRSYPAYALGNLAGHS